MNTQAQQSRPASRDQIGEALKILFNSMPLPRGVNPDQALVGYTNALNGYPIEAIATGIRKFLRGECNDVSPKFCPHPPELAAIVRGVVAPQLTGTQYFSYKAPKSKLLERNITRDYAKSLVDNGIHPRRSIWVPGDVNDRPDIGDLFAPDEEWNRPVSVKTQQEREHVTETGEQRARMTFKLSVLSKAIDLRQVELVAEANKRGLEDLIAIAQKWGVEVPESIWSQLKTAA